MAIETIFLDRDGIINEVIMRATTVSSPRHMNEFKIRKDFQAFYELIKECKKNLFIVSNQPDIRRNLLTKEALNEMTDHLEQFFVFKEIVYCLHIDEDNCLCRKPKPGMLSYLLDKYNLHPKQSLFVGDSIKDIQAGQAIGVPTVYLKQPYNPTCLLNPNYVINNLVEVIDLIFKGNL